MKIYFSPEYCGNVFMKADDNVSVFMDTMVVNTIGLINLLEFRLGIHLDEVSPHERIALYYDAMNKYIKENPENIFASSFNISGLSTAEIVLSWRDELSLANWNFNDKGISDRLDFIIGVEDYFRQIAYENNYADVCCDLSKRLSNIVDVIESSHKKFDDITLFLPCDKDLLRPFILTIIEVMESHGAKVHIVETAHDNDDNLSKVRKIISTNSKDKLTVGENDRSLLIWKFPDENLANEYFSYNDFKDVDVWINADNKQMDNWLRLMNRPMTGSIMKDCCPHLIQLFVTGISILGSSLNVNSLIEWLEMPVHPLDSSFRYKLAFDIANEGGYRNDKCRQDIKEYIEGKYVYDYRKVLTNEEQEKVNKGRKKREKYVKIFLPDFESKKNYSKEILTDFAKEISAWCGKKIHTMSEKGENMLWIEQLQTIDTMASAFLLLLDSVATDYIDDKIVDSWLSTIYRKLSFTNTIPEKECRTVIDSNGKFVTISNKTIWMGVDGEDSYQHECSFLYPSEKEGLIKCNHIRFWDETKEQLYYGYMKMLPFLMTRNQLILVVCEYRNGEITQKHPLYIRLKSSIENIELITEYPKIDISDKKEVDKISNIPVSGELNFKYADKLIWPRHLSPTSISTLIEYPFDFLMEKILHIEADSKVKMDDVKATMGNVAHAVIEKLFAPRGESKYSTFDDVESRFKRELKKIYIEIVEAKGAILLLYENRLREKLLYEQLKKCIKVLLEILKDNKLRVKACEKQVECNMNFGLNKELGDIIGVVDMILVDEKEKYIIFDFKWTSSKKYYPELLSKNRSIQLELYRYMLSTKVKNNIEKVAYFIMPEALLYSRESFDGKYCILQKSEDDSNIVEQLCNSVRYRMKQINSGVVETNDEFDSLQYVKESNEKNLFPLIKDDETNMKKSNIFSNYNLILK